MSRIVSPGVAIESTSIDLGVVDPGSFIDDCLRIYNNGDERLLIDLVDTSACSQSIRLEIPQTIAPMSMGTIGLWIPDFIGEGLRKDYVLLTNDPENPRVPVSVSFAIQRDYGETKP